MFAQPVRTSISSHTPFDWTRATRALDSRYKAKAESTARCGACHLEVVKCSYRIFRCSRYFLGTFCGRPGGTGCRTEYQNDSPRATAQRRVRCVPLVAKRVAGLRQAE